MSLYSRTAMKAALRNYERKCPINMPIPRPSYVADILSNARVNYMYGVIMGHPAQRPTLKEIN